MKPVEFDSSEASKGSQWWCRNGEVRTFVGNSGGGENPAGFQDDRGSVSYRRADGRMKPLADSQWDIVDVVR